MRKIKQWLEDIFEPEEFNDLNVTAIGEALNDPMVRTKWLLDLLSNLKQINIDVDRRLLTGTSEYGLTDLCARRKAYQDILEGVLSAKRAVAQEVRPNPRSQTVVNLDRVTV